MHGKRIRLSDVDVICLHRGGKSGAPNTYLVTLDDRRFYRIAAPTKRRAIQIAMSIGEIPKPLTPPPPSPGKTPAPEQKSAQRADLFYPIVPVSRRGANAPLKNPAAYKKKSVTHKNGYAARLTKRRSLVKKGGTETE